MSDLDLELRGYLVRRACHASNYVTGQQANGQPIGILENDCIVGPQAKR